MSSPTNGEPASTQFFSLDDEGDEYSEEEVAEQVGAARHRISDMLDEAA